MFWLRRLRSLIFSQLFGTVYLSIRCKLLLDTLTSWEKGSGQTDRWIRKWSYYGSVFVFWDPKTKASSLYMKLAEKLHTKNNKLLHILIICLVQLLLIYNFNEKYCISFCRRYEAGSRRTSSKATRLLVVAACRVTERFSLRVAWWIRCGDYSLLCAAASRDYTI